MIAPVSRLLAAMVVALSTTAAVLVAPAAPSYAAPATDGRWVGRVAGEPTDDLTFTVKKSGRRIVDFETTVVAVCTSFPGVSVRVVPVVPDLVTVARNGRFSSTWGNEEQTWTLSGRIKGRTVKAGRIVLSGFCEADTTYVAKRRR